MEVSILFWYQVDGSGDVMPNYLRVALAQIHAHPAYSDGSVNLLMEPTGDDTGLSKLSSILTIKAIRRNIYERYLNHIKVKVSNIIDRCITHNVNLLVLPEYSIPVELLEFIKAKAIDGKICVVAGSHLITSNYTKEYVAIGMDQVLVFTNGQPAVRPEYIRQAVSVIFLPDGRIETTFKHHRSQWESNLVLSTEPRRWIQMEIGQLSFELSVKICIDALREPNLPELQSGKSCLIVIPSWSSKTDYFESPSKLYLSQEIPVLYVNEASKGQTKVYGWCHRNNRNPFIGEDGSIELPANEEALIIADLDLDGQFGKVSTVCEHQPLSVVSISPIIYANYPEIASAVEVLNSSTVTKEHYQHLIEMTGIPELLGYKLTHLYELLEAGVARTEDIDFLTEFICMPMSEEPLQLLQYSFLKSVQSSLASVVSTAMGTEAVEILTKVLPKISQLEKSGIAKASAAILETDKQVETISSCLRPYFGRDAVYGKMKV